MAGRDRAAQSVRELILDPSALEDLRRWFKTDKRAASRILQLLQETLREPFAGKGKPEALKFDLSGCWSRRINLEHRLVYEVTDSHIRVLSCRYHYR